jgi:aminopeptidase N
LAPPRLEEGLASYLEFCVLDSLNGSSEVDRVADWFLNNIRASCEADAELLSMAPRDYGVHRQTGMSYTVGAIAYLLMHRVTGDSNFKKIIRDFYHDNWESGGSTDDFVHTAVRVDSTTMKQFTEDWFDSSHGVQMIAEGKSLAQLAAHYNK